MAAPIRTPDQRIRVFVSSTLKELEPERRAARTAIEALRLAPVMFELGARPHPPRELYRSYLEQSDIFVGLYWERYGWVAPDEEVSGLEDEYLLSTGLPALIYIKVPAPDREERLETLLDRIRNDDRTSYKTFSTPDELAALITGDLATLLAERFDAAESTPEPAPTPADVPAPYTRLVGRRAEQRAIVDLLAQPGTRIVSIVGPGGVGKSRLAIEIAVDAAATGRDVAFALLESVSSPERVISAIARALGVRDTGDAPLEDTVIGAVDDRDVLLVVDNMEHLLGAADLLVRLVTATPRLQLLVTSRSPLRVRAERVFELNPLDVPDDGASTEEAMASSSVALFLERAVAVRPGFTLTAESTPAVIAICRALDGMPLAIELAAARMRSLTPQQVLGRLDSALTLLVGGARDLPERQRALARTIQWSADLLDDDARRALRMLSVFSGSFTLASAEAVLGACGIADPLGALEALLDASLLSRTEHPAIPTYRLLSLVRAYGRRELDAEESEAVTAAWIAHYCALAVEAQVPLRGTGPQLEWLERLELEIENLAAVTHTLLDRRELDTAAEYAWPLYLFLWIGGYLGLVREWMLQLLDIAARESISIAPRTRAIALYYTNAVGYWQDPTFDATAGLVECRELFQRTDDRLDAALASISLGLALLTRPTGPDLAGAEAAFDDALDGFTAVGDAWGVAMALVVLGRVDMARGDFPGALRRFESSLEHARRQGELLAIVVSQSHRGWARLLSGDASGAEADFSEGLDRSLMLEHDEGISYGLEGFVGLRATQGDARSAGLLLGASQAVRRRKGILNPGGFEFYMIPLAAMRESGRGAELDAAIAEGLGLTPAQALARAGR